MRFFITNDRKGTKNIDSKHLQRLVKSFFFLMLCFLLLFFVGCKEQRIWKIGVLAPMTGGYSNYGILINKAVQMAVQEHAEQYGLIGGRDIKLILKDTQGNGEIAKVEVKKLLEEDNLLAIIGPFRSPVGLAIASDIQKARIPMIMTATNPSITEVGDYVFRITANSALPAKILAHYLVKKRQLSSLAVLRITDAYSIPIGRNAARTFQELGGKVSMLAGIPKGTTDFLPYLEALGSSPPEAIFLPIYPDDFAHFLTQFREDPRFKNTLVLGSSLIANNQLFLELAGDMAEG